MTITNTVGNKKLNRMSRQHMLCIGESSNLQQQRMFDMTNNQTEKIRQQAGPKKDAIITLKEQVQYHGIQESKLNGC